MRSFVAVLSAVVLSLGLLTTSAFAADESTDSDAGANSRSLPLQLQDYGLSVAGVDVTSANAADVLGDGTVSYDADTQTLVLDNAVIDYQQGGDDNSKGAILFNGDLNIELIGENRITSATCGVRALGSGDLVVTGGSLTVDAVYFGIGGADSALNVTLSGVRLSVEVDVKSPFIASGIQAGGQLSIVDDAHVDVAGAVAEAIPVVGNGGVLIKDSEVDARVLADGQYGSGIIISDGEVVVDNSTVEVGTSNTYNFGILAGNDLTSSEGAIRIKNNSQVTASSVAGMALWTMLGDIEIENSLVAATSSGHDAIYAMGDILIEGSADVTASGPYPALVATGDIVIDPQGVLIDVWSGETEEDASRTTVLQPSQSLTFGTSDNYFRSAPHVHEFIERIADDAHVATAATCTDPAHYYFSCVCGEVGTDTFASGDPLGHAFKDGACVVCGAEDPDYVPLESPEQPSDQPADNEGEEEGSSALPATGDAASPLAVAAFVSASLAGLVAIGAGMLARRRRNG